MKKIMSVLLVAAVAVGSIAGCSPSAEAILSKYKGYTVAEERDNKAELYIGAIDYKLDCYWVEIVSSQPGIRQDATNTQATIDRIRVYNAENLEKDVAYRMTLGTSSRSVGNEEPITIYSPTIQILEREKARYLLIYFEGINKDEVEEFETKPLFFLVDLKNKEVLTRTPLLAGSILG